MLMVVLYKVAGFRTAIVVIKDHTDVAIMVNDIWVYLKCLYMNRIRRICQAVSTLPSPYGISKMSSEEDGEAIVTIGLR